MKITEIAPTLLYLLGQPVADDFAADPRLDLFKPEFRSTHPVKRIASFEVEGKQMSRVDSRDYKQEDDLLLNRLEALGYIK